ncbi:aldose 1-epimerase family protein [Microvirga antarctica]|uniref:aldose 1-epimerase family protein n=1 Tax=Microvirga antarctica TaxID=2819233 RepID=UPI001B303E6D|nr:aldose 1-epimerase family protein [Microvirga antarctica]
MITLANDDLTVTLSLFGAELQSVTSRDGRSWLWSGDPAFWPSRAPVLFPVIGKNPQDRVLIDGVRYPMEGHGFARSSTFDLVEQEAQGCVLRLTDSEETRRSFPFAFALELAFALDGPTVLTTASISNTGSAPMPFCFGFHPGFVWPLPDSVGRAHQIRLEDGLSPAFIRADANGLMLPELHPSPFHNGELALVHDLFATGALVFHEGAGKALWYGAVDRPGIRVAFADMPQLGLWTKPGAPFLCIEPWHGLPAPADRAEGLAERRGSMTLEPGRSISLAMSMTFGVPAE